MKSLIAIIAAFTISCSSPKMDYGLIYRHDWVQINDSSFVQFNTEYSEFLGEKTPVNYNLHLIENGDHHFFYDIIGNDLIIDEYIYFSRDLKKAKVISVRDSLKYQQKTFDELLKKLIKYDSISI